MKLEKQLKDIIWETDNDKLNQRGLFISGEKRQSQNFKDFGKADFVTKDNDLWNPRLTIYEFLDGNISVSSVLKCLTILKGMRKFHDDCLIKNDSFLYSITIVGRSIPEESALLFFPYFFNNGEKIYEINFYTYSFDINGIRFNKIS